MMGGRGGVLAGALLLLISGGCVGRAGVGWSGAAGAGGSGVVGANGGWTIPAASPFPSLLVDNRSGYQVAVRLDGVRLGTATRGRTCLRVPRTMGELQLEFVPVGIAAELAPPVYLEESLHWRVELSPGVTIKYDVLSLAPSRDGCAANAKATKRTEE